MCQSRNIKKHLPFIKRICCLNIILSFLIIIYTGKNVENNFNPPPAISLLTLHLINTSLRDELVNERLASYSRLYDNSSNGCNKTNSLNEQQEQIFSNMSQLLIRLRKQMISYPDEYFHGRGIVLTVGPNQLDFAEVNLKMIERSGTRLGVQIWYSFDQISHQTMINLLKKAPTLNSSVCCFNTAQCRTLEQTWQLNTTHVYKPRVDNLPKHFPYKPAAIISATFAEVLFLDSDAYVTRDPEDLFVSDPMYLKFGALFFPDAHLSRQNQIVWKVFNTSCGEYEYELDSAAILVDKRRVWNGLYMTKLMNDNHELFYKAATDGDKDTFRLGFRYMNVKYYLVMIPCATGPFNGTHFCGLTLCKTDSLAQHIYINHVHIFKYENIEYNLANLEYTRIGLGDPNNNSFSFEHCRFPKVRTSCFNIKTKSNAQTNQGGCYPAGIPLEEIDNREYKLNEPLLYEKSRNNRILIGKTNNLMPHFVENLLKYLK